MARVLLALLVLGLAARVAQLEIRVAALAARSPCPSVATVRGVGVGDYDRRLERAVRLIDYCDGRG
jgi:hypothetical protein